MPRAAEVKVTRDMQRIMKMDAEILELRYLHVRELEREFELKKHTLLLSRGIKYRLDKLVRARDVLMKMHKDKPSQKVTYKIEMARRMESLDEAHTRMKWLNSQVEDKAKNMLLNPSEAKNREFQELMRDVKSQKVIITNKERSVANWAKRGEDTPVRFAKAKVQVEPTAEEDADEILEDLNFDQESSDEGVLEPSDSDEPKVYINPLESDPRWNVNPMANPGLDLLYKRPEVPTNDGGWGNPNASYTPPPQSSKPTIG